MADRTRLAVAGLFLALALAVVPALLPVAPVGADLGRRAEAAAPKIAAASVLRLRGGDLSPRPVASTHTPVSEDVLHLAISQAAPRSHTVASGETLWKISQDAGIGIEALAAANQLTLGAILRPGQLLVVPAVDAVPLKTSARTHQVAPGETLWGISGAWGVHTETLAAANHMSLDAVLHPGQILVVPGSESPGAVAPRLRAGGSVPRAGRNQRSAEQYEPLAGGSGQFEQPTNGMVTSRFGWRIHPIFGTREFHTGLDIANRIGTPVRAAEEGVVRFVGWMGGYGRLIVVTHANGLETSYSHLSDMLVTLGQRVVRGQLLGRMGNTGWSTGPHLLFEVRRNGVPLDPVLFLSGAKGATTAAASPAPSASPARSASPGSQTTAVAAPAPATPAEEHRSAPEPRNNNL